MATDLPSGVVTLVFTDIQGSSELWEQHQAAFHPLLDRHNHLIREILSRWNGFEVKTEGDAFFIVFVSASDAVQFAAEAQAAFAEHNWTVDRPPAEKDEEPTHLDLRVRMGMHSGEPLLGQHPDGSADYFGPVVNRAARVGSSGHGGQIIVSDAAHELAESSLPSAITFQNLAIHRLKGVGEERLWQVLHPDLSRDFPPLRTLNPERHNLPLPPAPYVGRETEIDTWYELLNQPTTRLMTLIGFGGMGKTRSALQLAELCVDNFTDGVWWVELDEARTNEEMIHRIAHLLLMDMQPQPSVKEQLTSFLRSRKTLLVLDNTEQIPEAAGVVKDLLSAGPDVKCLVTTRKALELRAERLVEVRPLPASDAETLFVDRARGRKADFVLTAENAGDVSELCRRLEGVPLAIELAASRIRGMSPREIVSRLNERFGLLQSRAPDLAPRQRALRAAIDWSYELLSEEDKMLFAQLSVFAGSFSLEDAEAVCEAPDVSWGVEELLSHSLLRSEIDPATQQTRYSMLESLRDYAAEKLEELGDARAELYERHAQHFLRVAQDCLHKLRTPEEGAALRSFELNFDNIRAAKDWAFSQGHDTFGIELSLTLGTFMQRRGFLNEAMRQIDFGITALRQLKDPPPRLHGKLLRECAGLHLDQFGWEEAYQCAEEALAAFEPLNETRDLADVNNLLGLAAMGLKDMGKARNHFTLALEQFRQGGDRVGIAIVQNNLGLAEFEAQDGSREKALQHWQESLCQHRENRNQRGIAETLTNLGVLAQEKEETDAAWRYHDEALQIEKQLRHTLGVARAMANLGELATSKGEKQTAYRLFAAADCLFDKVGSPYKHYTSELLNALSPQMQDDLNARHVSLKEKSLDEIITWALGEQ